MKKIMVLAALLSAMATLALVSCGAVVGGTSGGAFPALNDAERQIAGMSFSGNGMTYTFNEDKTGVADDGSGARFARAAAPGDIVGGFEWSAEQSGSNVAVTMTKGGATASATFDPAASSLTVGGQTFGNSTDRIVAEINLVRSNPALYAETYLKPRLANFDGKNYKEGKVTVVTQEGAAAVQAAITALSSLPSLPALTVEQGLRLSSKEHADWLAKTGNMGHTGENNSTPESRIAKYGSAGGAKENINYGVDRADARKIVIQQLIDDGTYDRAHRLTILDASLKFAGSYTTKYSKMPSGIAYGQGDDVNVSVINFASSYTVKTEYAGKNVTDSLSDVASTSSGSGGISGDLTGTLWFWTSGTSNLGRILYFQDGKTVVTAACSDKSQAINAVQGISGQNGAVSTSYTYDASTKTGNIASFPKTERYPDTPVGGTDFVIPGLWQSQGDFTYDGSSKLTIKDPTYFGMNPTGTPPVWEFVDKVN